MKIIPRRIIAAVVLTVGSAAAMAANLDCCASIECCMRMLACCF